jgi:hypothetical protein
MSNDRKLLVAGANNGRVMLWDAEMRENIWEYSHHTGRWFWGGAHERSYAVVAPSQMQGGMEVAPIPHTTPCHGQPHGAGLHP